ncbi:MAG: hypothetical protein OEY51_09380, partial [Cyclobacteriaceae bacterium]|nr:hypothetical protein [Cyclobacteriaceae bacterium]
MKKHIPLCVLTLFLLSCAHEKETDLSSFQIHPDFTLSLAAEEPLVFDPVDMEFDENGRAFVIEMPAYPNNDLPNRIVILDDTNHDGVFDKRTVFAEDLGVAVSLLPYKKGFLVAAPPELLFIQDTDKDDKADVRTVLMSGFSFGNTQHNYNGLTYGLDNWIYGANGGNSGAPYWIENKETTFPLRGNDFRFDPGRKLFERIGKSSGGYGLGVDNWGNIFETHNLEHISHLTFNEKYLSNVQLPGIGARKNISDHDVDGMSRIYPTGKQETRVNHPEQSGYFSGACGITFYGGGIFPENVEGNVFVADVVLNLIHRDIIGQAGPAYKASRDPERTNVEFLTSTDRAFRPV